MKQNEACNCGVKYVSVKVSKKSKEVKGLDNSFALGNLQNKKSFQMKFSIIPSLLDWEKLLGYYCTLNCGQRIYVELEIHFDFFLPYAPFDELSCIFR